MELDAEKFNTVKELAALGTEVANTKAYLTTLKSETEEFYREREAEARNRVHAVLLSAQALILEATKYHDDFTTFLATTKEIRQSVTEMVDSLSSLREETRAFSEAFDRFYRNALTDLAEREKNIAQQSRSLNKEQEYLNVQKEIISKENIRITDERRTLERAKERINK